MKKGITTSFASLSPESELLTGQETYPLLGNFITQQIANHIMSRMKGLTRHWSCLEKAQLAQKYFENGQIEMGSMFVFNKKMNGSYGYAYNPPYEFHAWLYLRNCNIIDFALPGVIEMGLQTKDSIGYILQEREPIILAGAPPKWIIYRRKSVVKFI